MLQSRHFILSKSASVMNSSGKKGLLFRNGYPPPYDDRVVGKLIMCSHLKKDDSTFLLFKGIEVPPRNFLSSLTERIF